MEKHLQASNPVRSTPGFRLALAGIAGVALILRIVILLDYLAKNPTAYDPWQDGASYWQWAAEIAGGKWIGDTPFLAAPLYPYLLGLLRAFGGGFVAVYVVQIGLHILTGITVGDATRIRFGARGGLLAAALYFALTEPASFALRILPNTVQLLLVAIQWRILARPSGAMPLQDSDAGATPAAPTLDWGRALVAGFVAGLLALAMPQAQLLILAWVIWIWFRTPAESLARRLRPAAALAVAAIVMILPATLHNWKVSGELIPITAHAGVTMRQGNSPVSQGIYTTVVGISANRERMHKDAAAAFEQQTGHPGTWGEIDAHFRRQAMSLWTNAPFAAAELFVKKTWWFLTSHNYDDQYPVVLEREFGVADRMFLAPVPTPWLIGAAAAGLVSVLLTKNRRGIEWLIIAVALLTTLIFFYTPRYRLAAIPPICGLAAYGLACVSRLRIPNYVAITIALFPAAGELLNRCVLEIDSRPRGAIDAGGMVAHFDSPDLMRPAYTRMLSGWYQRSGDRAIGESDLHGAEREYERALRVNPDNAAAMRQLGAVQLELGDPDSGAKLVEHALVFDNQDAPSNLRMYNVNATRGKLDEAAAFLSRALELDPDNAEAQLAHAWLRATSERSVLRNFLTAQDAAQRAIRLAGSDVDRRPDYYDVLAAAQAAADKFDEAEKSASQALDIARRNNDAAAVAVIESHLNSYREKRSWEGPPRLVKVPLRGR